jgi:mannose-6-phosphate isomerase-like protein (cupin superfamily)
MDARRVVTGHDSTGKAVFASDETVAPVTTTLLQGMEFHLLWGSDAKSRFPDDGSRPSAPRYFPPLDGTRFAFFSIPPEGATSLPAGLDFDAALAELNAKLPGLVDYVELDNPGMHTTASIDYGVVLSGEATLELDDGATVTLRPGDTYVQNGTRHRWSNSGDVPAIVAVVLIGAHHGVVVSEEPQGAGT